MRRVATAAAFGLDGDVLVDEWSLLVDMALRAGRIPARQSLRLADRTRPMRVMTVTALHQALIDPMVIWFGEIRFGRSMAAVAQLRLALNHKMLFLLRVMRGVAVETADVTAGMG